MLDGPPNAEHAHRGLVMICSVIGRRPMGSASGVEQSTTAPPLGVGPVIVLSRLELVSETVAAGLRGRGVDAVDFGWVSGFHYALHHLTESDTVLLLDDLVHREAAHAAHQLISGSRARIVVMTDCSEDAAWGALIASGAVAVIPTRTSLREVDAALGAIRRGDSPMTKAQRVRMVRAWTRWSDQDHELRARMRGLSERERAVIDLLANGSTVAEIGVGLSIAESTVRSHVKAVRRKLGVGSQLAAVAAVHRLTGVVSGFTSDVVESPVSEGIEEARKHFED